MFSLQIGFALSAKVVYSWRELLHQPVTEKSMSETATKEKCNFVSTKMKTEKNTHTLP